MRLRISAAPMALALSLLAPAPARAAETGRASFYGYESGRRTASGARFNPMAMTAAHRALPFGTRVRVTDTATGRRVDVVITDRGPFARGRVIDLSRGAARALGIERRGVAHVGITVLR